MSNSALTLCESSPPQLVDETPTTTLARLEPAESMDEIFEPLNPETLSDVFDAYDVELAEVVRVAEAAASPVVKHFVAANAERGGYVCASSLFDLPPAIKALDASYWQRTLELTDILDAMPAKMKREWLDMIADRTTAEFGRESVVATLRDLGAQRAHFFAQRVEGLFESLSRQHVTNSPMGFRKRMIIEGVFDGINHKGDVIHDFRKVVGRFMGRDGEMSHQLTTKAIRHARSQHRGEWVTLDGGAMRIRMYGNGNAHLEVHPEMAWRLNGVLAFLHPHAIPESNRRRPAKRAKIRDFELHSNPLPWPVLLVLMNGSHTQLEDGRSAFSLSYHDRDSAARPGAFEVLEALGGQPRAGAFYFDHDVSVTISAVVSSGCVPDKVAHQFFPTPGDIADDMAAAAEIGPEHSVLEPSAGLGSLARRAKGASLVMVEVSKLHCETLRALDIGQVVCGDFLAWSTADRFDRIVMNPPYSLRRWRLHLERAAELLAPGGRLVALLPAGAAKADMLPGWSCTFSEPRPFPGTSIQVVIVVAERR